MKKSLFYRLLGTTFLILTFMLSACIHSSAAISKQPPGICTVYSFDWTPDLQSTPDFSFGDFSFGVLPDPQWQPEPMPVCNIIVRVGKASPKKARQILYGLSDLPYSNPEKC